MKKLRVCFVVQALLLLGLTAATIFLLIETFQTHEAIRLVCRYLAGG